jgi:PhnB protein
MSVNPIPAGFHTVTPYLVVEGVPEMIDFMVAAFDAEEINRLQGPDGTIYNATVKIGDSMVMMGDANAEYPPMPTTLYLYVEALDAVYQQALQAGGISIQPPEDQFYGDRTAFVQDPYGNIWGIATQIEELSAEEVEKRLQA